MTPGDLSAFEEELAGLGLATQNRSAYAAAHVVVSDEVGEVIDWETTDAQRVFLDGHGFGIAEAMDTAQRFELGWNTARTLIERTAGLGLAHGFCAGASADHEPGSDRLPLDRLAAAVAWQVNFVRERGGLPVLLPMPSLSARGCGPNDYVKVYRRIIDGSTGPVLVHWLGPMFLERLDGYFPGDSFERIMALDRERIVGVKFSLLDAAREKAIRAELAPHGQLVYTGDDLHFAELICGEDEGDDDDPFSHALLGILDGIPRPAGLALRFLAHGQRNRFMELMQPCEQLSRLLFEAPTRHYKAGLAFLSWLDGRQANPYLPLCAHRHRDDVHRARLFDLALEARVFADPEAARARMNAGT